MHISVGLRIFSEDLDPASVTSLLQLEPSTSWKRGDLVPDSVMPDERHVSGGWFLYSYELSSAKVQDHFRWLIEKIMSKKAQLDQLKADACHIDICCNLSAGKSDGFVLPPKIVQDLAGLGVEIDFAMALDEEEEI